MAVLTDEIIYTPYRSGSTRINVKESVAYITFPVFDGYEEVSAAFSTRIGGVSRGYFAKMNLGLSNSDNPDNIAENYRRFANAVGIPLESFVISDQQHTDNIRVASKDDCEKGLTKPRDYSAVDGFITNERKVALLLLFADCVPVYLYDPLNHAIGLVHSGWKGTVKSISVKALTMMKDNYGTNPKDVIAQIAPSICKKCYEVSEDLYEAFSHTYEKDDLKKIFEPKSDGKYHLDLRLAVKIALKQAGVPEDNISVTDICTCCNPKFLFSHRYTGGKRGNLAAVLMLK